MAIDRRRLIRPGKKVRPTFLRSTSLQQMWVRVNQPFIPWTESSISQYKLHSFNIHKLLKKISEIGHPVLTFVVRAVASV